MSVITLPSYLFPVRNLMRVLPSENKTCEEIINERLDFSLRAEDHTHLARVAYVIFQDVQELGDLFPREKLTAGEVKNLAFVWNWFADKECENVWRLGQHYSAACRNSGLLSEHPEVVQRDSINKMDFAYFADFYSNICYQCDQALKDTEAFNSLLPLLTLCEERVGREEYNDFTAASESEEFFF